MKQNNNLRSGFVPILIVFIVAMVVAAGAYVVLKNRVAQAPVISNQILNTTTTSPSTYATPAGWKHYQSKTFHFSFDYPPNFTLSEEPLSGGGKVIVGEWIHLDALDKDPNKGIVMQATVRVPIQAHEDRFLLTPTCKDSVISVGRQNILALHSDCSPQSGYKTRFAEDQLAINSSTNLIFTYGTPDAPTVPAIAKNILSSMDGVQDYTIDFKPPPTISTQGWKHYQDAKYGFSFDYPENFTATVTVNPLTPSLEEIDINPTYQSFEAMTITVQNGTISRSTAADQFCGYQPEEVKIGKQGVHFLRGNCGDAGAISQFYVGALPARKIFQIGISGDGNAPGEPISEADFKGILLSLDGIASYESVLAH